MDFEFKCPNCNYLITEQDFKENDKILSKLKEIFNQHQTDYVKQLKQKLITQWGQQQADNLKAELAMQKNQLNEMKYQEIKRYETEIATHKVNLEKSLVQQAHELTKQHQDQIHHLNTQIATLNNTIKTNDIVTQKLLAEKLSDQNKLKFDELTRLNNIINQQKIDISNHQTKLEKLLLEKEQEVINQKQKEIDILRQQNAALKEANIQFKVIQNKTKGETFEHDVESELRKVFEPNDVITKITDQDKKADYLQEVRKDDVVIGKIVYEVKNAEWSNSWEKKLIEDMTKQKSKYGILVATSFNKKYPNIPFKRSDYNHNIYLCDAESFYFVGQILKTLIDIEYKLTINYSKNDASEKIKKFNEWQMSQLPKFTKIVEDNCKRIADNETSIIKRIDDIRIAREKIFDNWLKNIKVFLENIIF